MHGQEKHHTLLIDKCNNATVIISGKINMVSVNACTTGVVNKSNRFHHQQRIYFYICIYIYVCICIYIYIYIWACDIKLRPRFVTLDRPLSKIVGIMVWGLIWAHLARKGGVGDLRLCHSRFSKSQICENKSPTHLDSGSVPYRPKTKQNKSSFKCSHTIG